MIEKWKRYCGGSALLAYATLAEAGVWLIVAILSISGHWLHFDTGIAEWLTLPSAFMVFLSRPWTLLTYMWVHFDVLHMLFNVLWLYWFGRFLLISGTDRTLALYFFGGGICGGILFLAAAALGVGGGWLCGCSAAVIAVMCGAAIRHPNLEVGLFLIGNVRLKWVAIICCALTFIGGGGNQAAHIGGLVWGVALSLALLKGKTGRRSSDDSRRRKSDKMVKVLADRRKDMQRLDEILDKIKVSGYDSLSGKERKELAELSKRCGK